MQPLSSYTHTHPPFEMATLLNRKSLVSPTHIPKDLFSSQNVKFTSLHHPDYMVDNGMNICQMATGA